MDAKEEEQKQSVTVARLWATLSGAAAATCNCEMPPLCNSAHRSLILGSFWLHSCGS